MSKIFSNVFILMDWYVPGRGKIVPSFTYRRHLWNMVILFPSLTPSHLKSPQIVTWKVSHLSRLIPFSLTFLTSMDPESVVVLTFYPRFIRRLSWRKRHWRKCSRGRNFSEIKYNKGRRDPRRTDCLLGHYGFWITHSSSTTTQLLCLRVLDEGHWTSIN